jgi:uncharacterized protein HemX
MTNKKNKHTASLVGGKKNDMVESKIKPENLAKKQPENKDKKSNNSKIASKSASGFLGFFVSIFGAIWLLVGAFIKAIIPILSLAVVGFSVYMMYGYEQKLENIKNKMQEYTKDFNQEIKTREAMSNKVSTIYSLLDSSTERFLYLEEVMEEQANSIGNIEGKISILDNGRLNLIAMVNMIDVANMMWQKDYNRIDILILLRKVLLKAKKTKITNISKIKLAIMRDISNLESLYPADKPAIVDTLEKSILYLQDVSANPEAKNISNAIKNTTSNATAVVKSWKDKMVDMFDDLIVVRDKSISDEMLSSPMNIILFKQLLILKLEEIKLSVLLNMFSQAKTQLKVAIKDIGKYKYLSLVLADLKSIKKSVEILQHYKANNLESFSAMHSFSIMDNVSKKLKISMSK